MKYHAVANMFRGYKWPVVSTAAASNRNDRIFCILLILLLFPLALSSYSSMYLFLPQETQPELT